MVAHVSVADRLLQELARFDVEMEEFLDAIDIEPFDAVPAFVGLGRMSEWSPPPTTPRQRLTLHRFGKLDERGRRAQTALLKEFAGLFEHIEVLCQNGPSSAKEDLAKAREQVVKFIELDLSWGLVPKTRELAKQQYDRFRAPLLRALTDLRSDDVQRVVVPDTNALCACADWPQYASIAGSDEFTIVLLSTVLTELDNFKNDGRKSEAFRDKVKKVTKRIRGLQKQGSLTEGVTVNKTIRIRVRPNEPNFDKTLEWLDKSNFDDRIVASVLEIQRELPSSLVVLVSGDTSLPAKADAAKIAIEGPPGDNDEE